MVRGTTNWCTRSSRFFLLHTFASENLEETLGKPIFPYNMSHRNVSWGCIQLTTSHANLVLMCWTLICCTHWCLKTSNSLLKVLPWHLLMTVQPPNVWDFHSLPPVLFSPGGRGIGPPLLPSLLLVLRPWPRWCRKHLLISHFWIWHFRRPPSLVQASWWFFCLPTPLN